jgi:uncharacterized protein (TIGR02452 family)
MGLHMKENLKLNPVVLNMASFAYPGGGYKNGAAAQEESLFRRSCLHLCLDGSNNRNKQLYPISMDKNSAIYTNNVIIVRDNESNNYSYYRYDYKKMSVISCPAYRCDKILSPKEYDKKIYGIMYKKLDMILRLAYYNGHDSVVLGAFGCGAYHNPSEKIAKICKKLCDKYAYCFKMISFAIMTDKNDIDNAHKFNSYTNFESFSWIFRKNFDMLGWTLKDE